MTFLPVVLPINPAADVYNPKVFPLLTIKFVIFVLAAKLALLLFPASVEIFTLTLLLILYKL